MIAVVTRFQRNRDSTQKQEPQAYGTRNRLPAGAVWVWVEEHSCVFNAFYYVGRCPYWAGRGLAMNGDKEPCLPNYHYWTDLSGTNLEDDEWSLEAVLPKRHKGSSWNQTTAIPLATQLHNPGPAVAGWKIFSTHKNWRTFFAVPGLQEEASRNGVETDKNADKSSSSITIL